MALILRLYLTKEWIFYIIVLSAIAYSITAFSFFWKYYTINTDNRAVILTEEVNILSGPYKKDTVLFKLHAGTIVHYEREENGWSLISLPEKKRGWIDKKHIKLIKFNQTLYNE